MYYLLIEGQKGGNMPSEQNEISTSETEKILTIMKLLSRDLTREIIRSLLKGPKDLRTLCQEVDRRKTTVYEALKELVKAQIVSDRFIKTGSVGRTKKEYSIKEISIPSIPQNVMLDFLEEKDISSKSLGISDVGIALDIFSERAPVPPFIIFNEMLQSGIELKYAIQILVDLGGSANFENTYESYESFIDIIIKLMRERYPVEENSIETFSKMATKTINVVSSDQELILKVEDLEKIAKNELKLTDYESEFLASKILYEMKIFGFQKIEYEFIVILMYVHAKQMGIECEKPDYYVKSSITKEIETPLEISVREGSRIHLWGMVKTSDFFQRRFKIEKEKAIFLSKDLLEHLRYLKFDNYDISFIEFLGKEIMRKRGI
jgi:predicted transcriptional regulator